MKDKTNTFKLSNHITAEHLQGMLRGVEKESLRMQPNGYLAQSPHPKGLGSALTHPHVTTDYSESLLELITSPQKSIADMRNMLTELHGLVFHSLENDELLWPMSMPCLLSAKDEDIPLAQYGSSNIGQLKTLYRHGLGLRYGRRMQTIAGVHYNLSFPDALFTAIQKHNQAQGQANSQSLTDVKNNSYLGLIRNFKRLSPMVLFLMGASPCVCPCFLIGREHHLKPLANHSLYLPDATSLRMGKLGYQNSAQDDLDIAYNHLPDYIQGLQNAVNQPHPIFTAIGVDDETGHPIQINDHILQIENEFYSTIRPKQVANSGESPTHALAERGIAYIELRAVDLDPYCDIGISQHGAHFLETLALYCLLAPSPMLEKAEEATLANNQDQVVNAGRNPNTRILIQGESVNFHEWMQASLENMLPVAQLLDKSMQLNATDSNISDTNINATYNATDYEDSIYEMLARVKDPSLTPSAKVLADTTKMGSSWKLGSTLATQYADLYRKKYAECIKQFDTMDDCDVKNNKIHHYQQLVEQSFIDQRALEAKSDIDFVDFVQAYR